MEFTDLEPVGCAPDAGDLGTNQTGEILFEGYLAASHFYQSHPSLGGASGLEYGVSTSVAIQKMAYSAAGDFADGEGPRIDVENWDKPLTPETGTGTVDLEKINQKSDSSWYILGLIPATENVHEGLVALDEWHQQIRISGYLVHDNSSGNSPGYYSSTSHNAESDCTLSIGSNNKETMFVFVTSIQIDGGVISSSGESSDEWVHGDVAFLGRTGFILFALVVGIGGSIGAFILSKMFVLQGARSSMKTLIGKAGMDTIKQVKKDIKEAKSAGMISPTERKKEARKKDTQKQSPPKKKSEPEIAGFDLDSVLSSSPSMGATSEFGGGGSSVVATVESQDMEREIQQHDATSLPPIQSSSIPPQQNRGSVTSSEPSRQPPEHFSSAAPPSKRAPPSKKKTVRKRKASPSRVVESEPEPEPEPSQPARQTFDEPEEEFSDFSF